MNTDRIRAAADIVAIVSRYVRLRRVGSQYCGLCPLHREKRSSLFVHPEKQLWHCFGCGAGGDVFRFIQQIERVDFPRAKAIAADLAGVPLGDWPLTAIQRRAYAQAAADREYVEHLAIIRCAPVAHAREIWQDASANYRAWVRDDLEYSKAIAAMIVAMLSCAQAREISRPAEGPWA